MYRYTSYNYTCKREQKKVLCGHSDLFISLYNEESFIQYAYVQVHTDQKIIEINIANYEYCCHDCMVVGFTTTFLAHLAKGNVSFYHHLVSVVC